MLVKKILFSMKLFVVLIFIICQIKSNIGIIFIVEINVLNILSQTKEILRSQTKVFS